MSFPFEIEDNENEELKEADDTLVEYEVDFSTGQLTGKVVTGIDAIKVWIWIALHTTRYRYIIFSWDYGNELEDLIGKNYSKEYIDTVIPNMVKDCLLINNHILDVNSFSINFCNDKLTCKFNVVTDQGEMMIDV